MREQLQLLQYGDTETALARTGAAVNQCGLIDFTEFLTHIQAKSRAFFHGSIKRFKQFCLLRGGHAQAVVNDVDDAALGQVIPGHHQFR